MSKKRGFLKPVGLVVAGILGIAMQNQDAKSAENVLQDKESQNRMNSVEGRPSSEKLVLKNTDGMRNFNDHYSHSSHASHASHHSHYSGFTG